MSFLKASQIPFKITTGDSPVIGFPLGGPVVTYVTPMVNWAADNGASSILNFESSTPYGQSGEDPTWLTRGGDATWTSYAGPKVTIVTSSTVSGCTGKLTTGTGDLADFSTAYYITPSSGTENFFGCDADRTFITIVKCNNVGSASGEVAMMTGTNNNYYVTRHGTSGTAGTAGLDIWEGPATGYAVSVTQSGYVSGNVIIYMTTFNLSTMAMVGYIKGTGKVMSSSSGTRQAGYTLASAEAPYYGTDIKAIYYPTTDDVVHASVYPAVLTSVHLDEIAAIVGAT